MAPTNVSLVFGVELSCATSQHIPCNLRHIPLGCNLRQSLRTPLDNNIPYDEGEKGPQVLALEELAQSFAAAHHISSSFIQLRTTMELIQIDSD